MFENGSIFMKIEFQSSAERSLLFPTRVSCQLAAHTLMFPRSSGAANGLLWQRAAASHTHATDVSEPLTASLTHMTEPADLRGSTASPSLNPSLKSPATLACVSNEKQSTGASLKSNFRSLKMYAF